MEPITTAIALAQAAPAIVRWLTSDDKASTAANTVVEVAKAVTGQPSGDAALAAIQADPQLALAFKQRIAELEADMDKGYLADRADARARDIALAQAGQRNRRPDVLIVANFIGLALCLGLLVVFREKMPAEVVGMLGTIVGVFCTCLRDAHQFEFGSSRQSQAKDLTISNLSK